MLDGVGQNLNHIQDPAPPIRLCLAENSIHLLIERHANAATHTHTLPQQLLQQLL